MGQEQFRTRNKNIIKNRMDMKLKHNTIYTITLLTFAIVLSGCNTSSSGSLEGFLPLKINGFGDILVTAFGLSVVHWLFTQIVGLLLGGLSGYIVYLGLVVYIFSCRDYEGWQIFFILLFSFIINVILGLFLGGNSNRN